MPRLFPRNFPKTRTARAESNRLRDFGGGLNSVDDDISMSPRYAVTLENMRRTPSGAQAVRYGTKFQFDIADTADGDILDGVWFNGKHILVTDEGQVVSVTEDGTKELIWSSAIAAALPGTPSGWSTGLVAVSFVPFKNELVIHNGIDKPITISSAFVTTYLQDLATGSNTNTPIGLYGCVVGNYHVVAGIDADPTSIVVSSKGTAGTFPGDAAPNDSITLDVGAYTGESSTRIRGITGYRTLLIIFFATNSIAIQLGVYDGSDHTPTFSDTLPRFGLLGHRCIMPIENDILFTDFDGVNQLSRSLQSGLSDTKHLSELVTPHLIEHIEELTDNERLYNTWMVEDKSGKETLLFFNDHCMSRQAHRQLRYDAWSHYGGWNFTAGWRSLLGRVYLAAGTRVYQFGNGVFAGEDYAADLINDQDAVWANNTSYTVGQLIYDADTDATYTCAVAHISSASGTFAEDRTLSPTYWTLYEGETIDFTFELPWIDGRDPMQTKFLKALSLQTKGNAQFTVDAYVDNLYKALDGTVLYDPATSMQFIGNDARGFGVTEIPMGGGRKSADPRPFGYPVRFKTIKFILHGSVRDPLQIISLMFLFTRGAYNR